MVFFEVRFQFVAASRRPLKVTAVWAEIPLQMLVFVMSGEALLLREANLTVFAPVLLVVSIRQETTWWWDTSSCGDELMSLKVRWCFLAIGGVGVEETKISRVWEVSYRSV